MDRIVEDLINRIVWKIKHDCGLKPLKISEETRNYYWIVYSSDDRSFDVMIGVSDIDIMGEVLDEGHQKVVERLSPFSDHATATAKSVMFIKQHKDKFR